MKGKTVNLTSGEIGERELSVDEVAVYRAAQDAESQLVRAQKYQRRAAVKDELISWMADGNVARLKAGEWTKDDLIALMSDPQIDQTLKWISTLSFELACQSIQDCQSSLLTPLIKGSWIDKLQEHFY